MGTMINGSKIKDFYIAGNKIKGFAKNGEIVFKSWISTLKNIVYNADFRHGTNGFTGDRHVKSLSIQNGTLVYGLNGFAPDVQITLTEDLIARNNYYVKGLFNSSDDVVGNITIYLSNNGSGLTYSASGEFQKFSAIISPMFTDNPSHIEARLSSYDTNSLIMLKELMIIDVTEVINEGISNGKTYTEMSNEIKKQLNNVFFADEE